MFHLHLPMPISITIQLKSPTKITTLLNKQPNKTHSMIIFRLSFEKFVFRDAQHHQHLLLIEWNQFVFAIHYDNLMESIVILKSFIHELNGRCEVARELNRWSGVERRGSGNACCLPIISSVWQLWPIPWPSGIEIPGWIEGIHTQSKQTMATPKRWKHLDQFTNFDQSNHMKGTHRKWHALISLPAPSGQT